MRFIFAIAAAFMLAGAASAASPRYDMIVVAADDEEDVVRFIRNLDTGASAAFWNNGSGDPAFDSAADALLNEAKIRYGFDQPAPESDGGDKVKISLFGLKIDVEENGADENATISMPLGFGGGKLTVDARDDAGGERALVTIEKAKAKDAREFIDEIEDAGRDDRDAMKAHLGLD